MSEKQQKLVLAIIDFLNQSIDDGTVKQDDKEGLEVAVQCIGEAFGVDPSNTQQKDRLSIKPTNLMSLLDSYLTTRERVSGAGSTPAASTSKAADAPAAVNEADVNMWAANLERQFNEIHEKRRQIQEIREKTKELEGLNRLIRRAMFFMLTSSKGYEDFSETDSYYLTEYEFELGFEDDLSCSSEVWEYNGDDL